MGSDDPEKVTNMGLDTRCFGITAVLRRKGSDVT